ncbi:DUF3618 domain-containing protein [Oryzihumus sp.]|jgi:hypothetical protein|uniref:DUF3618 domain-containing protein n=1 Tax=Oryzihumus sp. TaxID=1968903 RepID=UPI002EDAA057
MAATPYDETGTPGSALDSQPSPATKAELEQDIALTRRELGETVEALSERLDVKSRAQAGVSRAVARARDSARTHVVPTAALAATAVATLTGLVVWRRRRP